MASGGGSRRLGQAPDGAETTWFNLMEPELPDHIDAEHDRKVYKAPKRADKGRKSERLPAVDDAEASRGVRFPPIQPRGHTSPQTAAVQQKERRKQRQERQEQSRKEQAMQWGEEQRVKWSQAQSSPPQPQAQDSPQRQQAEHQLEQQARARAQAEQEQQTQSR
jgi:hypothetical protein